MAQKCRVCHHRERPSIERDAASGLKLTLIAAKYDVPRDSIDRHQKMHFDPVKAAAPAPAHAHDPQAAAQLLQLRTLRLLKAAEANGDKRAALHAIREARENLESAAKLARAETGERFTVERDIVFQALRADLVKILDRFPEAKEAVIVAFGGKPLLPEEEAGEPLSASEMETPAS